MRISIPVHRIVRSCLFVAALSLLGASTGSAVAQAGNPNPGVVPPNARYGGLSYAEWQAGIIQWILSVPAADNAVLAGNEAEIANGQPQHVWFLADGGSPAPDRHFTVPAGKALYANIFTVNFDNVLCGPDTNFTVDQLRAMAKSIVDSVTDIDVEVDGVPVKDVAAYRSTSPVFAVTLPDDNILQFLGCTDALPGMYGPMIADGYAILLTPLPVGQHTIHESFVVVVDPSDPSQNVPIELTWHITVAPNGP